MAMTKPNLTPSWPSAGDELEIRRHERLSPLRVSTRPLGDLRRVRRGDCIVAFSRKGVHAYRAAIEGQGSERCCVVGLHAARVPIVMVALWHDPLGWVSAVLASLCQAWMAHPKGRLTDGGHAQGLGCFMVRGFYLQDVGSTSKRCGHCWTERRYVQGRHRRAGLGALLQGGG